jgi:hypothetical protein
MRTTLFGRAASLGVASVAGASESLVQYADSHLDCLVPNGLGGMVAVDAGRLNAARLSTGLARIEDPGKQLIGVAHDWRDG